MARFDLTNGEWAIIVPLLPAQGCGPRRKDERLVLNGMLYILRTGAPWRDSIRKTEDELPGDGPAIRSQMLAELSPHPSQSSFNQFAAVVG